MSHRPELIVPGTDSEPTTGPGVLTGSLTTDSGVALRTGARLVCADVRAASDAVAAGVPRAQILVQAEPGELKSVLAAGWATIVDVDRPSRSAPVSTDGAGQSWGAGGSERAGAERDEVAAAVALAAACAWRGVSAIRTRHDNEVRRGLDMTESIRGTRPPAWAVRGLA